MDPCGTVPDCGIGSPGLGAAVPGVGVAVPGAGATVPGAGLTVPGLVWPDDDRAPPAADAPADPDWPRA